MNATKVLLKIFSKIDLKEIKKIFDSIPFEYNGLIVLSNQQRELYYKNLEYKYENVFKIIYNKLLKEHND